MRCKHNNSWTITEIGDWVTSHTYEQGSVSHNNNPDDYKTMIHFECHECGFTANRSRHSKWAEKRLELVEVE